MSGTSEVLVKSLFLLGNFNEHVGKCAQGFEGVHGGNGIGKRNAKGRKMLELCDKKELCVANTLLYMPDKKKITYSVGGCETEIDFVFVGEKYRKYTRCKSDSM